MGNFEFGSKSIGRLKFRTASEARGAARDLGLSDVHSHMMDGERIFMPGKTHAKLNKALKARNLPPTSMPGQMSMSQGSADMGKMIGDSMSDADMSALDGNGMGGEFNAAAVPSVDEVTAKMDGAGMLGGELSEAALPSVDEVEASMDGAGMLGGEFTAASMDTGDVDMALADGLETDMGAQEGVAEDALSGVFVGDEDGDGDMEIY